MPERRTVRIPSDQLPLELLETDPALLPGAADVSDPQASPGIAPAVDSEILVASPSSLGTPGLEALSALSDASLEDLTEEQRAAVTHAEGPLLIVAGAGTGKTRVITRRIAHLITTRRVRPEQVLALTFTERAAAEMEERVDQLVPYGFTQVWISTFHAFGERVLREHALHIGLSPDFRVLSRPEQVIFLRDRLFEFPLDHFRPLGDPTRHIDALVALFSRAKDEDVTPEEYLAYADRLVVEAEARPDDTALAEGARQHQELAAAYRVYQHLLAREGRVDFGDLITLTLRLLR
jgi:DNA helicase-2/ATP-dependent DNA helicase PcrA